MRASPIQLFADFDANGCPGRRAEKFPADWQSAGGQQDLDHIANQLAELRLA